MDRCFEIIAGRRSVRKYGERPVPEETLENVLEAVRWSPSWANTQCWEIVVVRDPGLRRALQETLPPSGNPALKAIVAAPVLLALCGRRKCSGYDGDRAATKFGDWFMFDLGIASQTLCLAAAASGLGTVIVGLFDHDRAAEVLKVPGGVEVVALIPMGYPVKKSRAPERRTREAFVRRDTF